MEYHIIELCQSYFIHLVPICQYLSIMFIPFVSMIWAMIFFPENIKKIIVCQICLFLLKKSVKRKRPYIQCEKIKNYGRLPLHANASFPSAHTCGAYILGYVIGYPNITTIIFSMVRLILGVHHPTDVIAGGLLGYFTMNYF